HLFLAVWSVLGLFVYRYVARRGGGAHVHGRSPLVWMALFFLIFYCSAMWMRQAGQGAAKEACEHIAGYYETQLEALSGHARGAAQAAGDRRELDGQMQKAVDALFAKQLVQAGIVLSALWLLYGIFRAMNARVRRLETEKVRAEERSRAKSAFLFNMSHDLRTPMNAIIGYTDLARSRRVSGEEVRAYLDKIGDASQHLLALINDTLEMSRIENGKLELTPVDTDLRASVEDVCTLFASQLEAKGVRFEVDCRDVQRPFVKCDDSHFRRVVLNLVGNASKFTPAGGSVSVRLVQTASGEHAGEYELAVRDTGIGMSPEFAAKVFEAFEQERSSTQSGLQGTGLGMAITRSIVELMGGSIAVESEQGRGTCFTVHLPMPYSQAPEKAGPAASDGIHCDMDFKGMRLLLAEDNAINREIAEMILADAGFELDMAENGQEAVDKVAASRPGRYDAVLMDIQMPVMNGYDATKAIRALADPALASIPVVAMTANAMQEDIERARQCGMDGHIAKPIDIEAMLGTLDRILSK
ncbi:MAG: response regulator, partial [Desulfovibrio sp.]|nr:response regulator [Desulfovibrio sp.]